MKLSKILIVLAQLSIAAAEWNNGGGISLFGHEHHDVGRYTRSTNKLFRINESEYDNEEPPPKINGTGVPVKVSVTIYSVRGVNEVNAELSMEVRLQVWWMDVRLDYWKSKIPSGQKFVAVTYDNVRKIWHPDLYIDFVKEIIQPKLLGITPMSWRYYKNGYLRISTRVTLRMACPMKFHYYPIDQQRCSVEMKSYAFPDDVIAVQWNRESSNIFTLWNKTDLPNFHVNVEKPDQYVIETHSANKYTSIKFTVLLQRKLSYHFIQTYIPSTLFVVISWLSFLVPPDSVPGRMAICMTTLLSQTTMFSGIRQNVPKVSYPKALDIWMVACIFFVFGTLVEYTVVLKLRSLIAGENERLRTAGFDLDDKSKRSVPVNKYAYWAEHLERYTWMGIVGLFTIFNWVYWPWLLVSAGFFDQFGEDLYYRTE